MTAGLSSDAAEIVVVLVEELATVTPAMLEAASRVEDRAAAVNANEDQRLAAIWRVMLAAKLQSLAAD